MGIDELLAEARRERDEARAISDELAGIATAFLGWHLSRTPLTPDENHLEISRKITSAIQRWKEVKK